MDKKKTITISLYGGFHNSDEIKVRVESNNKNLSNVVYFNSGELSVDEFLQSVCSDGQYRKFQNHFCGMKDCMCGGLYRVSRDNITIN